MESSIHSIRKRTSKRKYHDKPIDADRKKTLISFLDSNIKGPFGNRVKFKLLDHKEMGESEIIKGAKHYIVGAIANVNKSMEDFGYCMEKNVLTATELELGTCWRGGTFNRNIFASKLEISDIELIPAIVTIGTPKVSLKTIIKSILMLFRKKRKGWGEIFYHGNTQTPLTKSEAGRYDVPIESVRLGPSASNMQPWRIIKERDKDNFHFLLKRREGYDNGVSGIRVQNIDMGIAMCHFELSANELGLKGCWKDDVLDLQIDGMEYIVSWVGS